MAITIPREPRGVWGATQRFRSSEKLHPGLRAARQLSDSEFRAVATVKVGPVKARWKGKVRLLVQPHQLDLSRWLPMTEPCGSDVLLVCYIGAGAMSQREASDFLSIMPIYSARLQEHPMRTHRFGRKIKLPATVAVKHQIRMRMARYEIMKAEAEARPEVFRGPPDANPSMSSTSFTTS
jgi:hypothetical protein